MQISGVIISSLQISSVQTSSLQPSIVQNISVKFNRVESSIEQISQYCKEISVVCISV